ncbi:Holliday junction branch migration protein RuvA [Lederbergia citrea]|uniref:Holliday junction branch migration complex subunit RuvA n=1 Tax=Lederbergia citrea TaxID=2833581 RepID=A0A942UPJ1_9BACI|nr:Holliday junction branch migration protein RuvA [Lederbergia citrea]MBS4176214.1 Holliday junction branch migration protein RuvA [Lederbergia citrea]MBS4202774.1 Holliday junction branch migration protein RuvA [Lederbergia citrea]MBS4222558.1 Holliday junction branch migration protein RuvA [Lederbergia citrea]
MYEYIKGTVEHTGPEFVVIDNNGIGYQILTPNPFIFSSKKGVETIIYTYQHVREDIIALYGFETIEEKLMFRKLLSVSGIGPKGALAILAFGEPGQVIRAIENEDEKFLTKFPGVGKKTARQMILDLKGKLHDVVPNVSFDLFSEELDVPAANNPRNEDELDEALLALAALGYSERELKKVGPKLEGKDWTTDQYIKQALQLLLK